MTHTSAYLEAHSQLCNAKLQETLRFQSKDLALNRDKGIITQAQKRRARLSTYPVAILMIVCGMWALESIVSGGPSNNVCGLIAGLVMGLFGLCSIPQTEKDLRDNALLSVHGPVTCEKPWSSKKYHLVIDNHTFMVDKPICEAFNSGELYTIYYLRADQLILAAEHHLNTPEQEHTS